MLLLGSHIFDAMECFIQNMALLVITFVYYNKQAKCFSIQKVTYIEKKIIQKKCMESLLLHRTIVSYELWCTTMLYYWKESDKKWYNTYSGIPTRSPSTMLNTPQYILSHLQQYRIPGISVEVHNGLYKLRSQGVALSRRWGLARSQVIHFRRKAVLAPDAVVIVDYTHRCVALP